MFWPDGRAYHGSYDSWLAAAGSMRSSRHCFVKNHIDVMLVLDSKSRPQSKEWATVCFARQMFDLILPLFGRQRTRSTERAATRGKTVANTVVNGRTSGECSSDQLGGGNKVGTARMTVTMALHPNGFSFA